MLNELIPNPSRDLNPLYEETEIDRDEAMLMLADISEFFCRDCVLEMVNELFDVLESED